jgi:hypothetical protein
MKRLVLCAVAVLLTSGALVGSRPAHACIINPPCVSQGCGPQCGPSEGVSKPVATPSARA